jgi:hypothetical protein
MKGAISLLLVAVTAASYLLRSRRTSVLASTSMFQGPFMACPTGHLPTVLPSVGYLSSVPAACNLPGALCRVRTAVRRLRLGLGLGLGLRLSGTRLGPSPVASQWSAPRLGIPSSRSWRLARDRRSPPEEGWLHILRREQLGATASCPQNLLDRLTSGSCRQTFDEKHHDIDTGLGSPMYQPLRSARLKFTASDEERHATN